MILWQGWAKEWPVLIIFVTYCVITLIFLVLTKLKRDRIRKEKISNESNLKK